MDFSYLLQGIIAGLAVSAPLGPMGIMCIRKALQHGFKSAMYLALGIAIADTLYAAAAGFSVSLVSDFLLTYKEPIRIIGSLFLLYIGYKIFVSHPAEPFRNKKEHCHKTATKEMFGVMLLTLSNPITIIFFGGFFASSHVSSSSPNVSLMVWGVFLGAMLWWAILSGIVHRHKNRFRLRNIWWINKITGALIVVLGIIGIVSCFVKEDFISGLIH